MYFVHKEYTTQSKKLLHKLRSLCRELGFKFSIIDFFALRHNWIALHVRIYFTLCLCPYTCIFSIYFVQGLQYFDSQLVYSVSSQEPVLKQHSLSVSTSVLVSSLPSNEAAALISAEVRSVGDGASCLNTTRGGQRRRANLDPRQEADWFGNHQSATNV